MMTDGSGKEKLDVERQASLMGVAAEGLASGEDAAVLGEFLFCLLISDHVRLVLSILFDTGTYSHGSDSSAVRVRCNTINVNS